MPARTGSHFESSTGPTFDERTNFINGRSVCNDSRILGESGYWSELNLVSFSCCNVQDVPGRGSGVGIVGRGDNPALNILANQGALDASD